jgi:hypothetical protein
MATKKETLGMLDRAQDYEEMLTVDIKGTLATNVLSSELPPKKKEEMLGYVEKLYSESVYHMKMLSSLRLRVIEGKENEY